MVTGLLVHCRGIPLLLILAALATPLAQPPATIDIQCTLEAGTWIFKIDPKAKSYVATGDANQTRTAIADVTDDTITLIQASEKITFTYTINRSTGNLRMDGGLTARNLAIVSYKGHCQRYEGKAF